MKNGSTRGLAFILIFTLHRHQYHTHEKFFAFYTKSSVAPSLPIWLTCPGVGAFLHRFIQTDKTDPLVDKLKIINVNPNYAQAS